MSKSEIHRNDIGTVIRRTCMDGSVVVDISSTTTKEIIFQKPDGSLLTKSASFTTDGTDGKIQVTSVDGDFDVVGVWRLQVSLVFPGGAFRSNVEEFKVYENLE